MITAAGVGVGIGVGMIVTSIIWFTCIVVFERKRRRDAKTNAWFRENYPGCSETGPLP